MKKRRDKDRLIELRNHYLGKLADVMQQQAGLEEQRKKYEARINVIEMKMERKK